jgi:hypothetical protein
LWKRKRPSGCCKDQIHVAKVLNKVIKKDVDKTLKLVDNLDVEAKGDKATNIDTDDGSFLPSNQDGPNIRRNMSFATKKSMTTRPK